MMKLGDLRPSLGRKLYLLISEILVFLGTPSPPSRFPDVSDTGSDISLVGSFQTFSEFFQAGINIDIIIGFYFFRRICRRC
jgi:hypothetical protein